MEEKMKLVTKDFDELTARELYEVMRARVAIFVVEQTRPYQELDGHDYESLHVFLEEEDGSVAAYLRGFLKEPGVVQMGRVLSARHGAGLGGRILDEGVRALRERFDPREIYIEAQTYATGYYERVGFRTCGEEFLEDDIPHVPMRLVFPGA